MKTIFVSLILALLGTAAPLQAAYNATLGGGHLSDSMLPRGVAAVRLESRYGHADSRFDRAGRRTSLADDLDGIAIDNRLVPGLPNGAVVGVTAMDIEVVGVHERLIFGYGLTDDLTIGVLLPWARIETRVDFRLLPGNVPGGSVEAVNAALGAPPFSYEPLRSQVVSGIQDPVIGVRLRVHGSARHALVLGGALRIGMTGDDDPHNLMDTNLGDGTTDLLASVEYFRQLGDHWDIGLGFEYTWQTPRKRLARARSTNEFLVPISRTEKMTEDKGDAQELVAELGYRIGAWRLSGAVSHYRRDATDWTSPSGQDVSGLEEDTWREETVLHGGVAWSSIDAWRAGDALLPAIVEVTAQRVVDGRNTVQSTEYHLNLTVPFR